MNERRERVSGGRGEEIDRILNRNNEQVALTYFQKIFIVNRLLV